MYDRICIERGESKCVSWDITLGQCKRKRAFELCKLGHAENRSAAGYNDSETLR